MEAIKEKWQQFIQRFGLSSRALKMIAVVTMLVDHVAAVLIIKMLISDEMMRIIDNGESKVLSILSLDCMDVINIYQIMRDIGRIAFPIYCFMLVEGFLRTRNIHRYLGRMFLFALISEIPFDLAFAGQVFYWEYQNVMFTLLAGLLAMYLSDLLRQKLNHKFLQLVTTVGVWLLCMQAAEWMMTDYGAKGVACIGVLYIFRYWRGLQLIGGALAFSWEMPAPVSFLLIALYNGKKGRSMKQFFYAFYPVHLLILYLISAALGMGSIAVI